MFRGRVQTERKGVVFLTYWDDSGSDSRSDLLVFGGVVVSHEQFRFLEFAHAETVRRLIPEERLPDFQEFHAFELINGQGVFEGIDFELRRAALAGLLHQLKQSRIRYFYSAVDKAQLRGTAAGSAEPLDVAFRMCVLALQEWATNEARSERAPVVEPFWVDGLSLVILDEADRDKKRLLRDSFKQFRVRAHLRVPAAGTLTHLHDAMYFGDSTDSVGLQLADACNFIMRRRLSGQEDYGLFTLIESQAVPAKPEPDWTMLKNALRSHV